jgi:hypothetical protein
MQMDLMSNREEWMHLHINCFVMQVYKKLRSLLLSVNYGEINDSKSIFTASYTKRIHPARRIKRHTRVVVVHSMCPGLQGTIRR